MPHRALLGTPLRAPFRTLHGTLPARLCSRVAGRARTPLLSGQVLIIFIMFLAFVLLLFAAVGLDVSGAYRVKEEQRQNVKLAQDSFSAYGNTLKFSGDPRAAVKKAALQALADNKYTGTAELWFFELGDGYISSSGTELPSSHRMMGATLTLSDEYKTVFMGLAGNGLSTIPVQTSSTWTNDLYSKSSVVWRPPIADLPSGYGIHVTWKITNGVATVVEDSAVTDVRSIPSGLSNALAKRVDSIRDSASSGG